MTSKLDYTTRWNRMRPFTLRQCLPIFREKYGVKHTESEILYILKRSNITGFPNEETYNSYIDMGFFSWHGIAITDETGVDIGATFQLMLSPKGAVFVGRYLQDPATHERVRLLEEFEEKSITEWYRLCDIAV
jgi:hypothetical protein